MHRIFLKPVIKDPTMKLALFCTIAFTCAVGIALADFNDMYSSMLGGGYGAGYGGGMGYGGMGGMGGMGGLGGYGKGMGSKVSFVPVYPGASRRGGNGGFLALIGLLFVIMILFGTNNNNNKNNFIFLNESSG